MRSLPRRPVGRAVGARDLPGLLAAVVGRQDGHLFDKLGKQFFDLPPWGAGPVWAAYLRVLWQARDEDDQPSDSEEAGLSGTPEDAAKVDPGVVVREVRFEVAPPLVDEVSDRAASPRLTPYRDHRALMSRM